MSEVEEILNKIKTHSSVEGLIIVNSEENIIKNTFGPDKKEFSEGLAKTIPQLAKKAKIAMKEVEISRDIEKSKENEKKETGGLTFLRIRSKYYEVMIAPDENYMMIVVQKTGDRKKEES
mmetsp:Transcript_28206/g.32641  ORF Transcript_28206/g.32641 Transcript_28206/m.32641 type:complete len:120 (+) Transcript_28206:23-382(+)